MEGEARHFSTHKSASPARKHCRAARRHQVESMGARPEVGYFLKGFGFQPVRTEPGFWINEQRVRRKKSGVNTQRLQWGHGLGHWVLLIQRD